MSLRGSRWKKDYSRKAVIYLIVNSINGKRYIGVSARNPRVRLREHVRTALAPWAKDNSHFYRAIRKHGSAVFSASVLQEYSSVREALAAEVRLIAELKPEYNTTTGGDGRPGGGPSHLTPEGRAKIIAIHTGQKRHVMPHSVETRLRLSEVNRQPECVERWKKYAGLGPKALSRPVICTDDGKIFESAASAARYYAVSVSALIELCLKNPRRKTVGKRKFEYIKERVRDAA